MQEVWAIVHSLQPQLELRFSAELICDCMCMLRARTFVGRLLYVYMWYINLKCEVYVRSCLYIYRNILVVLGCTYIHYYIYIIYNRS